MITVSIAGESRSIETATDSWINQQIDRRRKDGVAVCVVVTINTSGVNMTLSTPACSSAGGGGRPPNKNEQELFNLWAKHHLNTQDFTGGSVVGFLKQLPRSLAA